MPNLSVKCANISPHYRLHFKAIVLTCALSVQLQLVGTSRTEKYRGKKYAVNWKL